MTKPVTVREADIRRLIKAVQAAGCTIHGVEVEPNGTIRVLTEPGQRRTTAETPQDAFERWEIENGFRPAR